MSRPIFRRSAAVLAALLFLFSAAFADASLPQDTRGEVLLSEYMDRMNSALSSAGYATVDGVFLCFPTLASLGDASPDDLEIPGSLELTFELYDTSLDSLVVRSSDPDRFASVAAACITAASPSSTTFAEELKASSVYADKARKSPTTSFADTVSDLNGTSVRTYYAYYPDQYQDGVNWLQLTIIFPLEGYEDGGVMVTPAPEATSTPADEYEGITYLDDHPHFEVFTTATPEPDSPAGEEMAQ